MFSMRVMLLAGCVFVTAASSAQAGFQWTAPAGNPTMNSAGTMPRPIERAPRAAAAPVAPVMTESLPQNLDSISAGAPVSTMPDGPASAAPIYGSGMTSDPVTWNQPHPANVNAPRGPQNIMPAEAVPLSPTYPAPAAAQPVAANSMMAAQTTATAQPTYGTYEVAQGFGRDLPLVMAIRQIVPAHYGFVFQDGIDVSSHVSWQGGQPWDIVLQNTLSPLGMTATIRGNTVAISRGGGLQMAAAMGGSTGPQMTTETIAASGGMTMSPTPVSMISQPASPVIDDGMSGMPTGTGYVNARAASQEDLLANTTWTAPRNSSLRTILEGWSERVGVELYWASEYDYPIQSAVSIQGTFEEAVQTLLKGLVESKPRPMGRLHPNLPNGPAVLVIETRQHSSM